MTNDFKIKTKIKISLIVINIILIISTVSLFFCWLAFIKPAQLEYAEQIHHYAKLNLTNLPKITNEISADYFGDINQKNNEIASDDVHSEEIIQSELTLDQADELIKKTNNLIARNLDFSKPNEKSNIKHISYKEFPVAKIGLIVTNLGLNRKSTELALSLPKECALGFMPFTKSLKPLLHKAKSKGHEIFLYLPLQTAKTHENPGKYALMLDLPQEENMLRLNVILNSHARYDGVYTSYSEIFTDNSQASEAVFDHLLDKNLIFVMGKILNEEKPEHLLKRKNLVYSSVIIDSDPEEESIKSNLDKLVTKAKENGKALGYIQGYTLSIDIVKEWLANLSEKDIKHVTISELMEED